MELQRKLHLATGQRAVGLPEQRRRNHAYVVGEIRLVQNVERIDADFSVELSFAALNRKPAPEVDVNGELARSFPAIPADSRGPVVGNAIAIVVLSGRDVERQARPDRS